MSDIEDDAPDDVWKSKHYFGLTGAVDDVKYAIGAKETAAASAKLLGKTIFNTGLFAGKLGLAFVKDLPNQLPQAITRISEDALKSNPDMPQEKRDKFEATIEKYRHRKGED